MIPIISPWYSIFLSFAGIPMICIWESSHLASVPVIAGELGSFAEMFAAYVEVHPT